MNIKVAAFTVSEKSSNTLFTFPVNILKRAQSHVQIHRGSYMSAHVLLNLLNGLGKRDKLQEHEC